MEANQQITRDTELRRLQSNDVNRLAEILGLEGGRRLMEIIPKHWSILDSNNKSDAIGNGQLNSSSTLELKYRPEQIRVIEDAAKQNSGCYFAEILIQEWGTSGRKHERPTVGLLLQLLIQADLWHAAEFVAEKFLNEPPPARPLVGPGAKFSISIPTEFLNSVADFANDSANFPNTAELNANANGESSVGVNNQDYYTKLHRMEKDLDIPPVPPPRAQRAGRSQLQQQQKQLQTDNQITTAEANDRSKNTANQQIQQQNPQSSLLDSANMSSPNIPIMSDLIINSNSNSGSNPSDNSNGSSVIPMLTLLGGNVAASNGTIAENVASITSSGMNLPLLTKLNINSGSVELDGSMTLNTVADVPTSNRQREDSRCASSISNDSMCVADDNDVDEEEDDDDDDDYNVIDANIGDNDVDVELAEGNSEHDYFPNLSIMGRQSPNNDSSLTTVTCTSGENSFELSLNDSSSASNENSGLKK